MKINLNNIKNLIVRKALENREGEFMFWHNDKHSDHNDRYSESSYDDYYDHSDSNVEKEGYEETRGKICNGAGKRKTLCYDDHPSYDDSLNRYDDKYFEVNI